MSTRVEVISPPPPPAPRSGGATTGPLGMRLFLLRYLVLLSPPLLGAILPAILAVILFVLLLLVVAILNAAACALYAIGDWPGARRVRRQKRTP